MSGFDFVLVAYSIVLGVGFAKLIENVAWLVREQERVRFSGVHAGWVLITVLWLVGAWWDVFQLRDLPHWGWADFLMLLVGALLIVLQALLVTPGSDDTDPDSCIDLGAFFRSHRARILGVAAVYWTRNFVASLQFSDHLETPLSASLGQFLSIMPVVAVAIWRPERWVQYLCIVIFLVAHVVTRGFTEAGTLRVP